VSEASLAETMEMVLPYLDKDQRLLEVGCAAGELTCALAPRVQSIQGIDISSLMIRKTEERSGIEKLENIGFSHIDIFDASLCPCSFDMILAFNVMHFFEDRYQAMQRIAELLAPGGTFVSYTVALKESRSLQRFFLSLLSRTGLLPAIQFMTLNDLNETHAAPGLEQVEFRIIEESGLRHGLSVVRKINVTEH